MRGKWTGNHHHTECTATTRKYAVCEGSHESWNKVCIGKKRELFRMKDARGLTPRMFATKNDSPSDYQTSK